MTLPHLTWIKLLLKTYTFRATFKTQEQGQHTSNTSSKTRTHHTIDTIRASSIMVVILREDYG
jgi:hypothetical protein